MKVVETPRCRDEYEEYALKYHYRNSGRIHTPGYNQILGTMKALQNISRTPRSIASENAEEVRLLQKNRINISGTVSDKALGLMLRTLVEEQINGASWRRIDVM